MKELHVYLFVEYEKKLSCEVNRNNSLKHFSIWLRQLLVSEASPLLYNFVKGIVVVRIINQLFIGKKNKNNVGIHFLKL